jgi:hypothetical protein
MASDMNSDFETKGTWCVLSEDPIVTSWLEFVPQDNDVIFDWSSYNNLIMNEKDRRFFVKKNNIKQLIEIAEIFNENDSDHHLGALGGLFGRLELVARFDNIKDAIMFKLSL